MTDALPVLLHVALLSGRTAGVHVAPDSSVYELKLDAGQALNMSVATLSRQDGTLLAERSATDTAWVGIRRCWS